MKLQPLWNSQHKFGRRSGRRLNLLEVGLTSIVGYKGVWQVIRRLYLSVSSALRSIATAIGTNQSGSSRAIALNIILQGPCCRLSTATGAQAEAEGSRAGLQEGGCVIEV